MFCGNCGKEMNEGADFCSHCGAPVHKEGTEETGIQPNNNTQAVQQQPNAGQQSYQQTTYDNLESAISTARTLGILSIVGAFIITLAGLICGIIGFVKVKDLKVPDHLVVKRDSAKKLNIIGMSLSIGLVVIAIILVVVMSCAAGSYYYY